MTAVSSGSARHRAQKETIMTSDRHLALMALMRDLEAPSKTYQRSVRLAAAFASNSTQYDEAVAKGNAALDDIEQAVRRWIAAHPDPATVLSDVERTMLAYALDQAQEHIWSRDGFTDEDQAAVTSLRRFTTEEPQ